MNPAFLDSMSWEMAEVYGAITDQILINLSRYFPYMKAGSVPRSAFEYQAAMLAQMGKVNRETMQIIKNGLQGADKALAKCLEQSIIDAVGKAEPGLLKAVKAGILNPAGIPIVAPNQMRAFTLYYQQAADKLNLVNTVMLESTKSAYQQTVSDVVADIELADRVNATYSALDVAAGETITGVSSWNQSLRHAMDKLKDRGITGFVDHAGHQWSAEAYVAMDIRTTVYNTGRAAVWETNQNFGNDLYIVSYHDGARPGCYPWQNKVISATDDARTVTDLDGNEIEVIRQSDTSYGEAAGLFGINCKHYPTPFIPGVSALYDEGQIPSEKENEKIYENTQTQRGLERQLREQKRDLLIAKAQGASDAEIKALRQKCRDTSDQIDEFCKETGLPRRQNREGVFTQRDFPDADKYDVAAFERKQKDEIDQFFSGGGSQQGYTFGQMTPNEQITPQPPPTPTPVAPESGFVPAKTREEAEAYAITHFGNKYSEMSYKGIDLEYANTCNRVLTEINEKYDVSVLKGVQPMNMRTNAFRGSTAEAAYQWSGNGTLYINPTIYKTGKTFAAHKAEVDRLTKVCIDGGENILKSGKYKGTEKEWLETLLRTGRQCVSQSHDFVEGAFVHESGHMLEDKVFRNVYDDYFGTKGQFEGVRNFLSASREKYAGSISAYAVTSTREYIAESFTAWWYGEKDILDPALVRVFEGAMKQ